jgi:mitogen-activated protein kinase kinase
MKDAEKPALHAAPLDAVQSPSHDGTNGLETAVPAETAA